MLGVKIRLERDMSDFNNALANWMTKTIEKGNSRTCTKYGNAGLMIILL